MKRHHLILLLPLCLGCKQRETEYDVVDTPSPVPQEVEAPPKVAEGSPAEPDPEKVAQCVPGTGKNAQGECEALRTRKTPRVQQVQIPAGKFVMGDIPRHYDASEAREEPVTRWSGQPPRHAELPAFWIDLHEVTRHAYAECVDAGKCTAPKCPKGAQEEQPDSDEVVRSMPQTCVTHEQAQKYCAFRGARLPTEAEYEYAARGPDARIYPWGNQLMDEYRSTPMPVTGIVDTSYFGIKGLGSNVVEWVADPFELDVGVKSFVDGEFRKPDGPLARAMAKLPPSHVVKGGRAGARQRKSGSQMEVGFRCAADLDEGVQGLRVPAPAAAVPLVVGAGVQTFGGVAEAVDRDEAAAFCDRLQLEWEGDVLDDWRLPTLAEVQGDVREVFRGPGPFWTAEGAATQHDGSGKLPAPDAPWVAEDADPGEALAARCVRG